MADFSVTFSELPGIKKRRTRGVMCRRSVRSLLAAVCGKDAHRVGACASDHGSITVWRDDLGALRGMRCVRWNTMAETGTLTKRALTLWLKQQLPLLEHRP